MTIDEAIRILDKKTSATALREYDEIIRYAVVEEACKLACEIMRDHQVTEKAYQMAIDDDIKVTMENKQLKKENWDLADKCEQLIDEIEQLKKLA